MTFSGQLFFGSYDTKSTFKESNVLTHGGLGGHGGGALNLKTRHAVVDGIVSVNGQEKAQTGTAGGGSGGSIYFSCEDLSGLGTFLANGGKGSPGGGGGAGGRIAVYYNEVHKFDGTFMAHGGDSTAEIGGAGTVYLEQRNNSVVTNRTLLINNNKLKYPLAVQKNQGSLHNLLNGVYDDVSQVGGVTWLIEYQNHSLTNVDIRGNAHVAVLWKTSKGDIELRAEFLTGNNFDLLSLFVIVRLYCRLINWHLLSL